ncbi:MAG: hypothetical protein C5B54_01590 [Acidobacteria bacterium]|nr:MAG: hypothetical protein C5B54_01590 [Acidobacteriota bacterium]
MPAGCQRSTRSVQSTAMKGLAIYGTLLILAIILSSACYVFGLWQRVPQTSYTGIRPMNATDYNVNLSWIEQSRSGKILLRNPFDSLESKGFLIRPLYFVLSYPFAITSWSNTGVLHIIRLFCGVILLLALIRQIKVFEENSRTVFVTFLLLLFTSGAGVGVRRWLPGSIDLNIPEGNLFLTLGETPHFLYSLFLLWSAIAGFYAAANGKRTLWIPIIALALLWWEHPFDVVILGVVTGINIWQLKQSQRIRYAIGVILVSVPAVLYYHHIRNLPSFRGWEAQNIMLSPSFLSFLSGFAPLILCSIPTIVQIRQDSRRLIFLWSWIVAQFLLVHAPVDFQRRLIFGVEFPLALLAAMAIQKWKWPLIAGFILIASMTNVYVMSNQIREISTRRMPYYLPDSYQKAFHALEQKPDEGAVVSGYITGNFIPGYTGHPVYLGHSLLTPQIASRKKEASEFFANPTREFLLNNKIRYVFCGLEEHCPQQLPADWTSIYTGSAIAVFQVNTK